MEQRLHLDYETKSEIDLPQKGGDIYSAHESTGILIASWQYYEDGRLCDIGNWDRSQGSQLPKELREMLEDPAIANWAFNAEFERLISWRVAKIKRAYHQWRCTMAKASMHSFTGSLLDVGTQIGLPPEQLKDPEGTRLIGVFCKPQAITKKNEHRWRNWETDPDDWQRFIEYCDQDVVNEVAIYDRLEPFPIWDTAWEEYALDQKINDRGIPVDERLCENAKALADIRKREIIKEMREITGLKNPNSAQQLLPWLKERGYHFDDVQKESVIKVYERHEEVCKEENLDPETDSTMLEDEVFGEKITLPGITADCYKVLKLRRQSARTSVTKYGSFTKKARGGRFRGNTKFGGASRTFRYSARGVQVQNLHRTPAYLEPKGDNDYWLVTATDAIREADYDLVQLLCNEPMDMIAGCVRGAIRAGEGKHLVSCDLASIESVVIGWLARCERLLNVFRNGKDAYKDFATELFKVPYEEVTKAQRKLAKPATLGAGYRLGGGGEFKGKKTGLWGYGEGMGIRMTREQAHMSVEVFRSVYHEIPELWYDLEAAIARTLRTGNEHSVGPVTFEYRKPFLCAILPSGRRLYYYKPKLEKKTFISYDKKTGKPKINAETGEIETYTRTVFTYMGLHPDTRKWTRIESHGGKVTENLVQAIARDILQLGLFAADDAGFYIVMHVHDEIDAEEDEDDELHNGAALRECMIPVPWWAPDIPLNAAASEWKFYRKD